MRVSIDVEPLNISCPAAVAQQNASESRASRLRINADAAVSAMVTRRRRAAKNSKLKECVLSLRFCYTFHHLSKIARQYHAC